MADILTATPPAEDAAYYQQAFAQCLAEIDQLRAQMAQDQIEIDRSRTPTRDMLADIKATLGH